MTVLCGSKLPEAVTGLCCDLQEEKSTSFIVSHHSPRFKCAESVQTAVGTAGFLRVYVGVLWLNVFL